MSEAPETIWAQVTIRDPNYGTYAATPVLDAVNVRYTRADLPPTLATALELPEIKALVEAAKRAAHATTNDGITGRIYTDEAIALQRALAAIKEKKDE